MVLSIKINFNRQVPKGKDREYIYYAEIDFEEKDTPDNRYRYYNVEIYKETCKNIIDTIEKQIVSTNDDVEN